MKQIIMATDADLKDTYGLRLTYVLIYMNFYYFSL